MWKTSTFLLLIVFILLGVGIVILASTSGIKAQALYNDPNYFLKRQLAYMLIGAVLGILAFRLDYHFWQKLIVPLFFVSFIGLVLVLVPGIGAKIGGSSRWLRLGILSFQPSELAKLTLIIVISWWMAKKQKRINEFKMGTFYPLVMTGILILLIFIEPDFGTTMLCATVVFCIMLLGGARITYLTIFAIGGMTLFALAIMHNPNRLARIMAFMNPDKYAQTYAYQLMAALNAFINGGPFGVGLGKSVQKQYYLPEAHTDFIFAIIGEELGLISILIIFLFLTFFYLGLRISYKAPDIFGRLLAFGITLMITLQAAINIGVVTGCLPTKGLPLPFISFGGSSMLITLIEIGILLNIASHISGDFEDKHTKNVRDKLHTA